MLDVLSSTVNKTNYSNVPAMVRCSILLKMLRLYRDQRKHRLPRYTFQYMRMEQSHKGDVCGGFIMSGNISYLIIGNGIAGVTAAEILRNEDSAADITVIADDPFPVYYRPALKDYLAGRVREDKLWARPNSFYQDHNIRFLPERVIGIQAGQHTVQLQNGRQIGYNKLLLASGARASTLKCPGIDMVGVTTL